MQLIKFNELLKMQSKVRKMLDNMYALFITKFKDRFKAWDYFLEFIAADHYGSLIYQFNHKLEWLFEDQKLTKSLLNIYDSKLLKSDYYDHLGELYFDKVIVDKNQSLMSHDTADKLAMLNIGNNDAPLKILDPCVGTGRYLMATARLAPNALVFGVDSNLRLLRIAYTNFLIHNIKGYVLHANKKIHDIELNTKNGIHNWQFANKWNSCIGQLK